MAKSRKGDPARPESASEPSAEPQPGAPRDRAFDTWLKTQLEDFYGEIVNEPVPDSMIDLIKQHRNRKT